MARSRALQTFEASQIRAGRQRRTIQDGAAGGRARFTRTIDPRQPDFAFRLARGLRQPGENKDVEYTGDIRAQDIFPEAIQQAQINDEQITSEKLGALDEITIDNDNGLTFKDESGNEILILEPHDPFSGGGKQVKLKDGTGSEPGLSWISDPDTGIERGGPDQMIVICGKSDIAQFTSFVFSLKVPLQADDGTIGSPGIQFLNDNDTGIFRRGVNELGFSAGGAEIAHMNNLGDLVITAGFLQGNVKLPDGTAGSPSLTFSADIDTGIFKAGGNTIGFASGGTEHWNITDSIINVSGTGQIRAADGTSSAPGYNFANDTDTGIFRSGANVLSLVSGSGAQVDLASNWSPATDNAISTGQTGKRWTAVWAVDGTINTSHSSTKENIRDLADPEIPRGVRFKRGNHDFIGYLNDKLPDEARPKGDPKSNYTNAVIGILCHHVQKLKDKVEQLESQIGG